MIHRQGKTPSEKETDYICDFSRGRLNVRLYARIQPLLRGHKYGLFIFQVGCALDGDEVIYLIGEELGRGNRCIFQ